MHARLSAALILTALASTGCNLFGGESADAIVARREADGRAIGGACRHAGRAIEDCYTLNRRAEKASVYAGWREMNDYMRENKLEPVLPQLSTDTVAHASDGDAKKRAASGDKPADKGADKARAKDSAASAPAEKARKQES